MISLSISGTKPEEMELYERLALSPSKKCFNCCFDETFFKRMLVDEGFIKLLNDRVWGFSDCCITIDGKEIFKKVNGQAVALKEIPE